MDIFDRTKLLVGDINFAKIKKSSVILFGIGGVGGFVAEALVRSGIGELTIVDSDQVSVTNINRQLIATNSSIGQDKVEVMRERLLSINPNLVLRAEKFFVLPENLERFDFSIYDYVIDAIDTVSAKIAIIEKANKEGVPVISCMGTAGKLDPTKLKVADISQTRNCPLARVMRRELKRLGNLKVKTIFSEEEPRIYDGDSELLEEKGSCSRKAPPSMIFVPGTAGLIIASQVIADIMNK